MQVGPIQIEDRELDNRPLAELKPFFGRWDEVLLFHARQMSGRFSTGRNVEACEACERHAPEVEAKLQWRAIYGNTRTALITILSLLHHSAYMQADFQTYHGLCNACYGQLVRRRLVAEAARYAFFVLLLLGGGLAACSILFLAVLVLDFSWKNLGMFLLVFLPGIVGLVGAIRGKAKVDQWCVPATLRLISKPPFLLHNVRRADRKRSLSLS